MKNFLKQIKEKTKFKVFTKKNSSEQNIDLIDKLDKAMDDPDSEMMTAKYYEPDEIPFLLSGMSPDIFFPFKYLLPYFPL